jgi:hypothetical protein
MGSSWVAAQLAACQEELSSVSQWVSEWVVSEGGTTARELRIMKMFAVLPCVSFFIREDSYPDAPYTSVITYTKSE